MSKTTKQEIVTKTFTVNGISFDMMLVKAGTFMMGATDEMKYSPDDDEWWYRDQLPVHQVTLTKDYYIGKTPVTAEVWSAVMESDPLKYKGYVRPAVDMRWEELEEFLDKLNTITGLNFRLPTEAEWEFAARGGNNSNHYIYSGSNDADEVAWYAGNGDFGNHEVALLKPNELGLYDMIGNVGEFCSDWYGRYDSSVQTDPQGPKEGRAHVLRGGSYMCEDAFTCSNRSSLGIDEGYCDGDVGFRLVLSE